MANIWDSVVEDTHKATDLYFKDILAVFGLSFWTLSDLLYVLQDLKVNIVSRQWRTREACCLALSEVSGRVLSFAFHEVLASPRAQLQ
jgi:hypothetical protein